MSFTTSTTKHLCPTCGFSQDSYLHNKDDCINNLNKQIGELTKMNQELLEKFQAICEIVEGCY